MNGEDAIDQQNLTFSQAHGYEDLPQQLKLEELSKEARTKLWSLLYTLVRRESGYRFGDASSLGSIWKTIFMYLHINYHVLPANEFDASLGSFVNSYQRKFMNDSFNKVFDLLLAIMRHPQCPSLFTAAVALKFRECRLAYVVDVDPPPTIHPAANEEEGEAILRATTGLSKAGLASAVSHLRRASDCINRGDYPSAVRESIHAVESTARQIDPNAKALESALKALERAKVLHPALKRAFSNLYGYTSDEQGIRHALIDSQQPNVGQDEALFMLGACASFSSYLARKHRQSAP